AIAVWPQLEAQLVLAPAELQQRGRLVPQHFAFERWTFGVGEHEFQRDPRRPFAIDPGGEPGGQVLWLGQRLPAFFRWVAESAGELQLHSAVARALDLSKVCVHRLNSPG